MISALLVATLAAIPWAQPVRFERLPGWRTSSSGTVYTATLSDGTKIPLKEPESMAWISNVGYRDPPTADPPPRTLQRIADSRRGVVVFALIEPRWIAPGTRTIRLKLGRARHFLCCDNVVPSSYVSSWELSGADPHRSFYVIVRIYLPLAPSTRNVRDARHALAALRLPLPKR